MAEKEGAAHTLPVLTRGGNLGDKDPVDHEVTRVARSMVKAVSCLYLSVTFSYLYK